MTWQSSATTHNPPWSGFPDTLPNSSISTSVTTTTSFSRATDGYVFRDQFNRSDGTPGNGWSAPASYLLRSSELTWGAAAGAASYDSMGRDLAVGTDFIAQANFKKDTSDGQFRIDFRDSSGSRVLALTAKDFNTYNPRWFIYKSDVSHDSHPYGQAADIIGSENTVRAFNAQWHTMRLVSESASLAARAYYRQGIGSGSDITSDLSVLISDSTYTGPATSATRALIFTSRDGPGPTGSEPGEGAHHIWADEYFVCGRNIVVSGLSTGFYVGIDSRATVEETSGSVTFNVDSWALPLSAITVYHTDGTAIEGLAPSGGIWGGDRFDFSISVSVATSLSTLGTNTSWQGTGSAGATSWGGSSPSSATWVDSS